MGLNRDRLLLLLLQQRGMLLGYVTAIVREPHLAEDVFQNVALVLLRKGDRLEAEQDFPPWARRVARLEALAALRERRKSPQVLDDATLDRLEDHWDAGDSAPGPATEALRACLERLSPRARRLVELRYVGGLRGKDLAEKLAQPVNTVYVALSRIYRKLAACIQDRLASEGASHG
jgi:RNA polymerase sigma-70 factor (ECF subfamily)